MIIAAQTLSADLTWRRFTYLPNRAGIVRVNLAGTFNGWNKDVTPLNLGSDGRTWTTKVKLPLGKVEYKFVLNGADWVVDPQAREVPDGNGHTNSEIFVMPADYDRPASPTDGITAVSALLHRQAEPLLNYDRGRLQIEFRARPNDLAEVDLTVNGKAFPMPEIAHDELFATYRLEIPWDRKENFAYEFKLRDGSKTEYYGAQGLESYEKHEFELIAKNFHPFTVPNWIEGTVIYQIFPDRFADGDTSNDPKNVQPSSGKPTYWNRFGGDVAGVREHLDYLKGLGVGAVYFNPIFQSPSNHRYDTTDYRKVDPEFGTNEEFDSLAKQMRREGIRTVLDFAFNHTATNFFAFKDIREKGEKSKFLPWYFIKSFPVVVKPNPSYVAWDNYPSLPKLNTVNPDTEKYILETVDYWMSHADIAGARLDVANEVDQKLWRDLRVHAKAKDSNFWIVGEEWGDANKWLQGDQWDSTMGYQFRDACLGLFVNHTLTPSTFLSRLNAIYASYPPQVSRNLMNLIGSHDTPRFLTLCNGDEQTLRLAATVQLTWPGTPSIYYGDELGMQGGVDPDNRRMMDWSAATPQNPTLDYYKLLIKARNGNSALREGAPLLLDTNVPESSFAFARVYNQNAALIAVNASDHSQTISISIPAGERYHALRTSLTDVVGGESYHIDRELSIRIPSKAAAILLPSKDHDLIHSLLGMSHAYKLNFSGHRSPISSQGAK